MLLQVLGISFQFVLSLRTDLYAALITSLGCLNLSRVSRLHMARRYRPLSAAEEQEIESADLRDQAAARWYGWVQLGGLLVALLYLAVYFVPAIVHMLSWLNVVSPGHRQVPPDSGSTAAPPALGLSVIFRRAPACATASGESNGREAEHRVVPVLPESRCADSGLRLAFACGHRRRDTRSLRRRPRAGPADERAIA